MSYKMSDKVKFSILVSTNDGLNHMISLDIDQPDPITDETIKKVEERYMNAVNEGDVISCTVMSFSRYENS